MPLPVPAPQENEDEFMSRCIEWTLENDEAEDQEQAAAICADQWEDNKSMKRKELPVEIEEQSALGGRIRINTGALDRQSDRVLPSGALIENYMKNPVVQWGHDYRSPWATIGKTDQLTVSNDAIVAEFTLREPANETDPMHIIRALWQQGLIRTASIGFNPVDGGYEQNEEGGLDFKQWELLEWSLVPVPANQDALRLTVKALGSEAPESHQDQQESETPETTDPAPERTDTDNELGPELREATLEFIAAIRSLYEEKDHV